MAEYFSEQKSFPLNVQNIFFKEKGINFRKCGNKMSIVNLLEMLISLRKDTQLRIFLCI